MRWLVILAAALALVAGLVWFGQRALIYFPDRRDPGPVTALVDHGEDVQLQTSDGLTLQVWRIDPVRPADVAVLYLPGNGGNRLGRIGVGRALADQGFTVLLLDYRGYGGNPGRPSEAGLVRDAEAAQAYLRQAGFAADDTLYVGESLGTGVAVQLADRVAPAALVLRSPFTSLGAVAEGTFGGLPIGWIVRDRFDTLGTIPSLHVPVAVLAGSADTVVPPSQSQTIAQAAPDLVAWTKLPGVGHNDAVWFGPYLAEQVADYLEAIHAR